MSDSFANAMRLAIEEASRFVGATSPNPPVGAAALDREGAVLGVQAHQLAGTGHAEARLLRDCAERGLSGRVETVVVTLEPCNHQGRTGPCTEAILALPSVRRVVFGARDPNPKVKGGGAERLKQAGLETLSLEESSHPLADACRELIRPFRHWVTTGLPWVTVKTARTAEGSMIPPPGRKTFTSPDSLKLAHELRRRADAIITGSGTILADRPELTVRLVPDHPGKRRWLVVLDRRGRVPADWLKEAEARGFRPVTGLGFEEALRFLGSEGALEALVEAGPGLSGAVLSTPLWNDHVVITQGTPDRVELRRRS
jgi:diaminohydroxyphosphoribosylaminopyrimidine deaminase / 5-amino-6-(5-phosphoribosylamino)uracil reductase